MGKILLVCLVVLCVLAPATSEAAPQTWMHDSTYVHAAAETLTIVPSWPLGKFSAQAWTVAIIDSCGQDTMSCSCTLFGPNLSTAARGRQFTLNTLMAPKFSTRVDSIQLGFSQGHGQVRVLFVAANGTEGLPDLNIGPAQGLTEHDTLSVSLIDVYALIVHETDVSATSLDSIPGTTAKYHHSIWKVEVAADDTVWVNFVDAAGDSLSAGFRIWPDERWIFKPIDLYMLKFAKATNNAHVRTVLYKGGAERVAP